MTIAPIPRPLGSTGLVATPVGLGLAALGRPAYINLGRDIGEERSVDELERLTHEALDAAYARGVRYVDAARSYGRAEEFLASWLASRRPPALTIGSKWGYRYVGDWRIEAEVHEVKDHSLGALDEQFAETISWLGADLDLYQIHSATLESGVLEDRAVLSRLIEIRDGGPAIGLSVSGPAQPEIIRTALEVDVDGDNPFSCVQATWNLLEQSAGPALAEAHDAGWGVIVKESLANGRLVAEAPATDAVAEIAARTGVGRDAVAIAACLIQPWAGVVLSGATSVSQLDSNLAALTLDLSPEDHARLTGMRQDPPTYWETRSRLRWD